MSFFIFHLFIFSRPTTFISHFYPSIIIRVLIAFKIIVISHPSINILFSSDFYLNYFTLCLLLVTFYSPVPPPSILIFPPLYFLLLHRLHLIPGQFKHLFKSLSKEFCAYPDANIIIRVELFIIQKHEHQLL